MQQYLNLMKHIIHHGSVVKNERTGATCLVSLNHKITFNVGEGAFPILTTRKINWKAAINEMVCYIRGYTELDQFHALGVHTWDANAKAWGNGRSVGLIYGASSEEVGVSYVDILNKIKDTPYDRGIIWNFWNPALFEHGCLRPCMYSHQFNVIDNTLHLTSTQRSVDVPLGLAFNMIQCYFLLDVTARITGLKAGTVTMNLVNCHIYENQLPYALQHIRREPELYVMPKLIWTEDIRLPSLLTGTVTDKLKVVDYDPHPAIKYPFTE